MSFYYPITDNKNKQSISFAAAARALTIVIDF